MAKQIEQLPSLASADQTPADGQSALHGHQQSPEAFPTQQRVIQNKKKTEWHHLIGAARLMWSKVSEAELLASAGEEQNLTNIVSARYVLSYNTANAQVKKFLATQAIADLCQPAS